MPSATAQRSYEGRCHCGAAGFDYRTAIAPADWSVRDCQCRFCRTHAARSTSDPAGSLTFVAARADTLRRYRFALRTADFLLCRQCGVYLGAVIVDSNDAFGIINTRALLAPPPDIAATAPSRYDDETTGDRIARRRARWTPVPRDSLSWPGDDPGQALR